MADDPAGKRILRRAANLLTIQQLSSPPPQDSQLPHPGLKRGGLSASLRRKFSQVKEKSRSLGINIGGAGIPPTSPIRSNSSPALNSPPVVPARGQQHARSYSESLTKRPVLDPHPPTPRRFSSTAESAPLSGVPEVSSPVLSPAVPPSLTQTENMEYPGSNSPGDVTVPLLLQQGTPMTKVSAKKHSKVVFRLDPDQGHILWKSKVLRIIPIETIKELRSGADARYYREQFGLAQAYESRWLTIIYILDGTYKTLHLIAATAGVHRMWDVTLRKMHGVRVELMSGLGNGEVRDRVWERVYWKGRSTSERPTPNDADQGNLDFADVEKLCLRLGVSSAREDLERLFKQADTQNRHYLDFTDFQRFVKLLKKRPEISRIYKTLRAANSTGKHLFDFHVFERFMRDTQMSICTTDQLRAIFEKYAAVPVTGPSAESPPILPPLALNSPTVDPFFVNVEASTASAPLSLTLEQFTAFLLSPYNSAFSERDPVSNLATPPLGHSLHPHGHVRSRANSAVASATAAAVSAVNTTAKPSCTSTAAPASSSTAAATIAPHLHDMTRPLSEYYISSSHNTYLVGHQLVGVSTIEGYIRALLQGCRSVEIDIYDGDVEPMIFHGKTFTSKVSLREVCAAIAKYGFVASPYPLIISAEIHCGLVQQQMIVDIMIEVFGDALVRAPKDSMAVSTNGEAALLPSPDALKGRILLKAKNLHIVSEMEAVEAESDTTSTSGTSASASESEGLTRVKSKGKELKHEFQRARTAIQRVRSGRRASSSAAATPPRPSPPLYNSSATLSPPPTSQAINEKPKVKVCAALMMLLVYTVGVKCRGINKKEEYATEHIFSLSENTATKMLRQGTGALDLVKHNRTHLVRIYPKGLRLSSSNYEPQRYWAVGAQLVALNWQTFDLGYMINHTMFQRNGRAGYVLKPKPLRVPDKALLSERTRHYLDLEVISAQQLPRPKNATPTATIDPYVEVSVHVPPEWVSPSSTPSANGGLLLSPPPTSNGALATYKTCVVKNNGFNPIWHESLRIDFECVAGMLDLVFVRFAVRLEDREDDLAVYCASLGSLQSGYRHLALHDAQMSQYLFSTLFVKVGIHDSM